MSARTHDLVLFGATGFTGQLVAAYLSAHAPSSLRVALAGRNREKLEALGTKLPLVIADSSDAAAMERLAADTRVVCTTVGPYAKHGHPLAAACAKAGTHYCDLTGETQFMRDSIDRNDAAAKASGARIVHTCGFDSIPSELGVLMLHEQLGALGRVTGCVEKFKGGISGGTVASLLNVAEEVAGDRARRRLLADPYALSPDRSQDPDGRDERDQATLVRDELAGRWTAPFVMAQVNTRVVRRSNALLGYAYGKKFRYREVSAVPRGPAALAVTAFPFGVAAVYASMRFAALKPLVKAVLPKPGEGPDANAREHGALRVRFFGESEDGARRAIARVEGKGDPGYKLTSLMLGEAALCLALDEDKLPKRAGVLTPASAMGRVLIDRLNAAGMTLTLDA